MASPGICAAVHAIASAVSRCLADLIAAVTLAFAEVSPSRAYHDSLWEALDEDAVPSDARLRERFLLGHLDAERERLGRVVRVLDLGCGDGYFARPMLAAGAEVLAVDVSGEAVRRARERVGAPPGRGADRLAGPGGFGGPGAPHGAGGDRFRARVIDADAPLPFEDACLDVVWAGETIEHVADTAGWLSEVRRVLRPSARLLLSTPGHGLLIRLRLLLSARAFAEHFDPRADHLRFYTRGALVDLLADFGFGEVEVRGAGGVPGARRVLLGSARRNRF